MAFSDRSPANEPLRFSPASPEYLELTEAPAPPVWRESALLRRKASTQPLTDEQRLIKLVKRGDRTAFARVIEQHQRTIFGYLRARMADSHDAEDLAQDVFLRLYQGRKRLSPEIELRPWLIGIAKNLLREHARLQKRRKEVAWTELCIELDEVVSSPEPGGYNALKLLPGCIESLGPSARSALDLHYHSQMQVIEIAARFKRSEGAIKLLMYRARQAIRRCLDKKSLELKSKE